MTLVIRKTFRIILQQRRSVVSSNGVVVHYSSFFKCHHYPTPFILSAIEVSSNQLFRTMSNEYDSDELSKLLILYLHIKDCGKNDRVLFESMFEKGVMMPTDQIRTPSSDWKESMGSLSMFLSMGRDEPKVFKKSAAALTYKD